MHSSSVRYLCVVECLPFHWARVAPPYRSSLDHRCLPVTATATATAKLHCRQLPRSYYIRGLSKGTRGHTSPYPPMYRYQTTHVPNCNDPLTPTHQLVPRNPREPKHGKDHDGWSSLSAAFIPRSGMESGTMREEFAETVHAIWAVVEDSAVQRLMLAQ